MERPGRGPPVRGVACSVVLIVLDKLPFQCSVINLTYISQGKTIYKNVLYRDRIGVEMFSTEEFYIILKFL